ncbi:hypothetical protein vBBceSLY5_0026 [Bacillus phage vB_BceS_LY5]|uniref:hypothetical protein n=1 Tax=Bacillus phage vB_BceS_LY5 TaxID=2996058 RepID=UPI004054F9D8|nr:hypothetical protein vBBceSLY5_0026 [Bacillus phage vB_BceS_LY5]
MKKVKRDYKLIKDHLAKQGVTQRQLADELEVAEATVSQILGGYGRPFSIDEAVKIITKYGGTIEMFKN